MLPDVATITITRAACCVENRATLLRRGAGSKPNSKPTSRAKLLGFTLIELLITIVIASILASIAIPSFREFIAGQRIKTASFDIMSTLTLARSEAIKRNASAATPVNVTPTGGAWINGWSVTAPDGTLLSQQSALPGLTITCITGGVAGACYVVAYAGSGRLVASVPSVQLSSTATNSISCISIDLSGRPNSKVGACS